MRQAKLEYDFGWRQKGVSAGRGWWVFVNGAPCTSCGQAAKFERGGTGKAGTGERVCGYCRRQARKAA